MQLYVLLCDNMRLHIFVMQARIQLACRRILNIFIIQNPTHLTSSLFMPYQGAYSATQTIYAITCWLCVHTCSPHVGWIWDSFWDWEPDPFNLHPNPSLLYFLLLSSLLSLFFFLFINLQYFLDVIKLRYHHLIIWPKTIGMVNWLSGIIPLLICPRHFDGIA